MEPSKLYITLLELYDQQKDVLYIIFNQPPGIFFI